MTDVIRQIADAQIPAPTHQAQRAPDQCPITGRSGTLGGVIVRVLPEGAPEEVERVFGVIVTALAFAGEYAGEDFQWRAESCGQPYQPQAGAAR
jgi:hypothetical protein